MKLYRFSLKITSFLLICISTGMLLISLLYKAIYRYDDSPAFIRNGLGDLIALLILLLLFALGYHWREKINRYFSVKYSILIYFILAIFFVLLVPLKPFSDMQQIYQASLEVSKGNWKYFCKDNSYFTQYPNNLLITLLYGFLFVVLPKNVLVLKVLNILEIIGIVWISEKTVQLYHKNSYRNLFFVYGLSLISVFLYTNHIYTDLLFVFFSVLGLYLYMKNPAHIGYAIALYSILFFVRPQAVFYIIAILLHYFFKGNASMIKKISHIICLILLFLVCRFAITNAIEKPLIGDLSHSMPAASYVYMAFNEEEFGFQDGTHDINRTFSDVADRLAGYDLKTLVKIICKKMEWTWTEGTYQAQRYAFGENSNTQDKFSYSTSLTRYCLDSNAAWRQLLDSFMRTQYLFLFILTIPMFFRKNQNKYDIFIMLFAAHMIFYIFWEIKSRYLLPLYPIMLIVSFITLNDFSVKKASRD